MSVQLVCYQGRPAAVASAERFTLVGEAEGLPDGDPTVRFVAYMALYARDLIAREQHGSYHDEDAERFARHALIDPDTLDQHAHIPDAELAARLRVPTEQVGAARREALKPAG